MVIILLAARAASAVEVYFLGNSLTAYNDVPGMIQQMRTAAVGHPGDFTFAMHILLGQGLAQHWAAPAAHAGLASRAFDLVVLQDYSLNPTDAPHVTRTYARLWDAEVKSVHPDAGTLTYAVWERLDRPGSQGQIDAVYGGLAAEFGGAMVPAGDALALARAQRPGLALYADPVHANRAGSYLAAAVFYARIFGQSPVGLPAPAGIAPADALFLQDVAWQAASAGTLRAWAGDGFDGAWDAQHNWAGQRLPGLADRAALVAPAGQYRAADYARPAAAGSPVLRLATLDVEAEPGGAFTFRHARDALVVMGDVRVGRLPGGLAEYRISGDASLRASSLRLSDGDGSSTSGGGAGAFTQDGGSVTLSGALSIAAPPGPASAQYALNAGSLRAGSVRVMGGGASFYQGGGTLDVAGAFDVAAGGRAHLAGGLVTAGAIRIYGPDASLELGYNSADNVVRAGSLAVEDGATLDVARGVLIIDPPPGTDPRATFASLTRLLADSRNGPLGRWANGGLTSVLARYDPLGITGIGVLLNDDGGGRPVWTRFAGQPVDAGDVILRFTYAGDLDLDGVITVRDYFRADRGRAVGLTGYHNGDVDLDGQVTSDDYLLLDRAMMNQFGPLAGTMRPRPAVVPEPAAILPAAILAATLLRRRRGRRPRA